MGSPKLWSEGVEGLPIRESVDTESGPEKKPSLSICTVVVDHVVSAYTSLLSISQEIVKESAHPRREGMPIDVLADIAVHHLDRISPPVAGAISGAHEEKRGTQVATRHHDLVGRNLKVPPRRSAGKTCGLSPAVFGFDQNLLHGGIGDDIHPVFLRHRDIGHQCPRTRIVLAHDGAAAVTTVEAVLAGGLSPSRIVAHSFGYLVEELVPGRVHLIRKGVDVEHPPYLRHRLP